MKFGLDRNHDRISLKERISFCANYQFVPQYVEETVCVCVRMYVCVPLTSCMESSSLVSW